MRTIIAVFISLASLSICLACSCLNDDDLIDKICNAPFAGKVTPTKLVETEQGLLYYELAVPKSSKRKVSRAYRSVSPVLMDCSGSKLMLNKPYLLTGDFFDPDKKFVDYSTCKVAIPWGDFRKMREYKAFLRGCNKKN